jgi:hypothetical protein
VYFTDTNTGYAAGWKLLVWGGGSGYDGIVLKTINGGTNWTIISSPLSLGGLFSIHFTDASTGYAAGAGILKTIDGGLSWTSVWVGSNLMNSVYFTNVNTGYAVGRDGIIIKTSDGGTTWTDLTSGTSNNLLSVNFTDANTGYVVGTGGTILKTVYGLGIHENQQTNSFKNSLKIYPDPATEKITIEKSEPGSNMKGAITIYGMTGQELIKQQVQGLMVEINVSSLPTGIYFIKLMNGDKTLLGKFLKE